MPAPVRLRPPPLLRSSTAFSPPPPKKKNAVPAIVVCAALPGPHLAVIPLPLRLTQVHGPLLICYPPPLPRPRRAHLGLLNDPSLERPDAQTTACELDEVQQLLLRRCNICKQAGKVNALLAVPND